MKKITFFASALLLFATTFTSCDMDDDDDDDIYGTEEDIQNGNSDNQQGSFVNQFSEWSKDEINKANTAANAKMNQVDKDIILYCNLARMDGTKFMNTYAKKYLTKSNSYVTSLKEDLSKTKNLQMMYPDEGLYKAAKEHSEDMRDNNYFEHRNTWDRIKKYYSKFACNENIAAGHSEALDITMQWLIDEGVEKLGHRKAILNSEAAAVGIYTTTHPNWRYCSTMDFGTELEHKM